MASPFDDLVPAGKQVANPFGDLVPAQGQPSAGPSTQPDYTQFGSPTGAELNAMGAAGTPEIANKAATSVLEYAKQMLPQDREGWMRAANIPTDYRNPEQLAEFAFPFSKPMFDTAHGAVARAEQVQAADQTPPWSQERFNAGIGTVLDLAQLAAIMHGVGRTPEVGAIAPESPVARPDAQIAPETPPVQSEALQSQTARVQPTPELSESEAEALNRQIAPEGDVIAPEVPESAGEAPKVREALSLDELRLMREKGDLQLQNDIAQRVGGRGHPAIDERIRQIDNELDSIANEALQKPRNELPAGAFDEIRAGESATTDRSAEDASLQDQLGPLQEREARPIDNATIGTVGESTGQQPADIEQPASVGRRGELAPDDGRSASIDAGAAGTNNRLNTEIYGEDAVPSGQGVDTVELLDNARAAIRSGATDPYSVLSKTRAKGIANPEEYAALSAEHERLVNDAVAKQKANDPAAPEAAKRAEDFANAIQPHKTAASDLFRLFQGDLNYDLSTPFGMNEYMKSELGRGMKPSEVPRFTKMSNDIRGAESEVGRAVQRSDARVRTRYSKVADISMMDAVARVRDMLKDCV